MIREKIAKQKIIIALLFGTAAFLVIFLKIHINIFGNQVTMDPGEIFITLGVFFTGIPGAVVITVFRSVGSFLHLQPGIAAASFTAHLAGALFIALSGRIIGRCREHPFYQFLLWAGAVVIYYYAFLILIFNVVNFFFVRTVYLQNFGGKTHFWKIYTAIGISVIPEVIYTFFFTTAVFFLLPKRYRGA